MIRETLSFARAVAVFSAVLALIAFLTTPGECSSSHCRGLHRRRGGARRRVGDHAARRLRGAAFFLVMYVTQLADLANAFCKVLHVPYKYAFTFTSAVRFIPVFMNDMAGIMEAQTARGVEFDVGLARKLRLMVPLCVPLLVSSVRKTGSAAIAAQVRGFELRTPASGFKEYPVLGARRGGVRGVVYGAADGDRRVLEGRSSEAAVVFFLPFALEREGRLGDYKRMRIALNLIIDAHPRCAWTLSRGFDGRRKATFDAIGKCEEARACLLHDAAFGLDGRDRPLCASVRICRRGRGGSARNRRGPGFP